jgi:hypothetical protein
MNYKYLLIVFFWVSAFFFFSGCLEDPARNAQLASGEEAAPGETKPAQKPAEKPAAKAEQPATKKQEAEPEEDFSDLKIEDEDVLSTAAIEKIINTRKVRGDVKPVGPDKLKKVAEAKLAGWTRADLQDHTMTEDNGVVVTMATWTLKRGGQTIEVMLTDLNNDRASLITSWKLHNQDLTVSSPDGFQKVFKPNKDVIGFESVTNGDNLAVVSVLVANRFTLMISGKGFKKTDELKTYLKAMDLSDLISLASK